MRGQTGLMEYIIMTFFIVIVIVVLIFFLTGFQISQFSSQKYQNTMDHALFLMKQTSSSPIFVKEEGVFDDAKLTALASLPNLCGELRDRFGGEWFFEVRVLDNSDDVLCTADSYPECNLWSFCTTEKTFIAYDIPVNVYMNTKTKLETDVLPGNDLALLKVGVYE